MIDYDEQDEAADDMDEFEEAMQNCCGNFGRDGVFWCGAAGSEDCDFECPFSHDIGMTLPEIEARDVEEMAQAVRDRKAEIDAACDPWFTFEYSRSKT